MALFLRRGRCALSPLLRLQGYRSFSGPFLARPRKLSLGYDLFTLRAYRSLELPDLPDLFDLLELLELLELLSSAILVACEQTLDRLLPR